LDEIIGFFVPKIAIPYLNTLAQVLTQKYLDNQFVSSGMIACAGIFELLLDLICYLLAY